MRKARQHDHIEQHTRMPWTAALVYRLGFRFRWWLTPILVGLAAWPAGYFTAATRSLFGPEWAAMHTAVTMVMIVLWLTLKLNAAYDRVYGATAAALWLVFASLIANRPTTAGLVGVWVLAVKVAGIPWWYGPVFRSRADFDKMAARFANTKLGESGARLLEYSTTKAGDVFRFRRPRDLPWSSVKAEDVADDFDVDPGRVILNRDGGRNGTVKILKSEVFRKGAVPHPALAPGAREPGGSWAPGTRSVLDPIPFGEDADGNETTVRLWTEDGDAQHWAFFGMSGAGKSGSVSNVMAGVAASRDGLLVVSDTPKKGATAAPYTDVIDWLAVHADATKAMFAALYSLSEWRCAQLAPRGWDKWIPSEDDPGVVAVIEEMAALLIRYPEIGDQVEEAALLFRQAGISLVIVSQGGDWDSIPINVRRQIRGVVVHRMEASALRVVWPKSAGAIDTTIFAVPGLCYVNDGGGIDDVDGLLPVKAYALYKVPDKRAIAAAYAAHRPHLSADSTKAMGEAYARRPADPFAVQEGTPVQTTPLRSSKRADTAGQVAAARAAADALDNNPPLAGGSLEQVVAAVPAEPVVDTAEDDQLSERVLAVLRTAEGGLPMRDLATACEGWSASTVYRRICALRDLGRVRATGRGASVRWHLAAETVEAV